MPLLTVDHVRVEFGGIVALADLSFTVDEGEICALIGPNGAGKTTLFNCLSRLYEVKEGDIEFDGQDLLALPAHKVAKAGIARTFQNLALFPALSVARERDGRRALPGRVVEGVRAEARSNCSVGSALPTWPTTPRPGCRTARLKRVEIARALAARSEAAAARRARGRAHALRGRRAR